MMILHTYKKIPAALGIIEEFSLSSEALNQILWGLALAFP
jgi:hypothetical protein